jgi:hypothetical protein
VQAFKFLKELGLEKPSWLPNFSGKDKNGAEQVRCSAAIEIMRQTCLRYCFPFTTPWPRQTCARVVYAGRTPCTR